MRVLMLSHAQPPWGAVEDLRRRLTARNACTRLFESTIIVVAARAAETESQSAGTARPRKASAGWAPRARSI